MVRVIFHRIYDQEIKEFLHDENRLFWEKF